MALSLAAPFAFAAAGDGDAAAGKEIFETKCIVCHNADSKDKKIGPGLAGIKDGKLPSGKGFSSPAELKGLLALREASLARNLTERLMAYALGRQLEGYDQIVVDRLLAEVAKDKYRVRSIIVEVITSYLFTHRRI